MALGACVRAPRGEAACEPQPITHLCLLLDLANEHAVSKGNHALDGTLLREGVRGGGV